MGTSQKILFTPWCRKLVTGLIVKPHSRYVKEPESGIEVGNSEMDRADHFGSLEVE